MAGAIAGTAILNSLKIVDELHTITLTINNQCNMACSHCYMHYDGPNKIISKSIISSILESNFEHLVIVGREPFFDARSIRICNEIINLVNKLSKKVSIISNGVNLENTINVDYRKINYVDISFDGGPITYKKYRRGDYNKIIENIKKIAKLGFDRFNALNVMNIFTLDNLDDMMNVINDFNFKKIMFSPYLKTNSFKKNIDQSVPIESILYKLGECSAFIDSTNSFLLLDIFHISQYGKGVDYIKYVINLLGIAHKVKFINEDPLFHGFIRVTYDGYVLNPYESLHTKNYKLSKYSIYDEKLDIIFKRMLEDTAYKSIKKAV